MHSEINSLLSRVSSNNKYFTNLDFPVESIETKNGSNFWDRSLFALPGLSGFHVSLMASPLLGPVEFVVVGSNIGLVQQNRPWLQKTSIRETVCACQKTAMPMKGCFNVDLMMVFVEFHGNNMYISKKHMQNRYVICKPKYRDNVNVICMHTT